MLLRFLRSLWFTEIVYLHFSSFVTYFIIAVFFFFYFEEEKKED